MPKKTITVVVCDNCDATLNAGTYVDASYYGPVLCEGCWTKLSGNDLAKLLDLEVERREVANDERLGYPWHSPSRAAR